MKKIVIVPYCDDLNRGDQALVWETRDMLFEAIGACDVSLICANENYLQTKAEGISIIEPVLKHPSRVMKNNQAGYGPKIKLIWGGIAVLDYIASKALCCKEIRNMVRPLLSESLRHTLLTFQEADFVVVKGGGFVHSYGGITDAYLMYYSLFHIRLALKMGKKVIFMPNSFGPLVNQTARKIACNTLKKCSLVFSRESYSKEFLDSFGISNQLYPDLGFFLNSNRALPVPEMICRRKCVAFTVRPYRFPGCSEPQSKFDEYLRSIEDLARFVYDRGYLPVFIDHTRAINYHERDIECIKLVTENLQDIEYEIISDANYTCRDLKAIYSNMYAIVGTRFHSVVFSMAEYVPAIAVTYGGNKGAGIMKDLGLSKYAIKIEDCNADYLRRAFASLEENYHEYQETLRAQMQRIIVEKNAMIDCIREFARA